ncbi:MAG: cytochrome c oxidase subunit 3 [Abditibacteriales bacterium]|nr:cytochrome c oxidase subunit 3 [Abditibacteriales bacterium]MDW8366644.1 cytochrome c oxidase subunit 3 [Abditibacteriales bacterium]
MHEPHTVPLEKVLQSDWGGGKSPYAVSWGKLMMWLFILSDAFTFGGLLAGYGALRVSSRQWPDASAIFALHIGGKSVPLLLIALMTFILICSSFTMAMAVASAYKGQKQRTAKFLLLTILLGLVFLGCQAYEWSNLIHEGLRPWRAPQEAPFLGIAQFGACFFTITGFHGSHVLSGVIYLAIIALRVLSGVYERRGSYEGVEIAGLYWHFVDLVWVFVFTFFYLF